MCDGYDVGDEAIQPDLEDEFLCEYVDGTMDPVVREVFEEYIRANPDLREHIECLRHTRLLLCRYGCRCHAPRDLHDQLRRRITCDLLQHAVPFHVVAADRLKDAAAVSCAVAVLLMLGLVAGAGFTELDDDYQQVVSAAVVSAHDLPPAVRPSTGPATAAQSRTSVIASPAYSPRNEQIHPLNTGRSLVAAGIEHEIRTGSRANFAAAFDRLAP